MQGVPNFDGRVFKLKSSFIDGRIPIIFITTYIGLINCIFFKDNQQMQPNKMLYSDILLNQVNLLLHYRIFFVTNHS